MASLSRSDNLAELRRRVDALFDSASGRVGPSHADLATFVSRLGATADALLRERFPGAVPESATQQPEATKRQRRESVVCSGSWEEKFDTVEELERERGTSVYEDVTVVIEGGSDMVMRQFVSHFWSSGCRLWDSAVALGRFVQANPALVRGRRVIELGCGVAPIPGLCAARVATSVRLTDGESNLLPSVGHNLARAQAGSPGLAASVEVAQLNWGAAPERLAADHGRHDVLLGSDLIYSSGASKPLAAAADSLVAEGGLLLMTCPAGRHGIQ
eukprot:3237082-Prymnesium_polylepis.1